MNPTNKQLIEKVTYTASLVSDYAQIDVLLDPLRIITSRAGGSTEEDKKTLLAVQDRLEAYLLKKEKLRLFTAESLKLQIEQHMEGSNIYKRSKLQLQGIVTLAILAILIVPFLPGVPHEPFSLVRLTGFTAVSILHLGAAWLFFTALTSFQTELRRAFVVICAGIILLGLGLLEQPLIELFGWRGVPFIGVYIAMPLVVASALINLGVFKYARLVGMKSPFLLSWKPITIAAVVLVMIGWFAPHIPVSEPEIAFDLAAILQGWVAIFPVTAFLALGKMESKLAEVYKPPVRAFRQSMIPIILVTTYVYAVRLAVGSSLEGAVGIIAFTLLIFEGIFLVRAGYVFNRVSRY